MDNKKTITESTDYGFNAQRVYDRERALLNHEKASLAKLPDLKFSGQVNPKISDGDVLEGQMIGLAFSGGGIRSAAFNLGVLQSLAQKSPTADAKGVKFLDYIDYLSTVSGGGYIGSWFSALLKRGAGLAYVKKVLDQDYADARFNPSSIFSPSTQKPWRMDHPLRWIRRYGSYLTPEGGLFSKDTLSLVATFLRNAVINVTQITGVMLLLLFAFSLLISVGKNFIEDIFTGTALYYSAAAVFAFLGFWINISLISVDGKLYRDYTCFKKRLGMLAMPLLAVLICGYAALLLQALSINKVDSVDYASVKSFSLLWCLPQLTLCALAIIASTLFMTRKHKAKSDSWITLGLFLMCMLAAFATCFYAYSNIKIPYEKYSFYIHHAMILVVLSFWLSLFIAFTGRFYSSYVHEWWSRLCAFTIMLALGLYVLMFIAIDFPKAFFDFIKENKPGSFLAFFLSTMAMYSGIKSAFGTSEQRWLGKILLKMLPYLAILVFILLVSLLHAGLFVVNRDHHPVIAFAVVIIVVLFLCLSDINLFSLHMMYRNRLIRCFLGASHQERNSLPETDFDPDDAIWLADIDKQRPYQLINAAVNFSNAGVFSSGQAHEWQDRHSHSFLFSGMYCGYLNCYQPTRSYIQQKNRNEDPKLSLGLAMTVSGAAANPNMGYNTKPGLAFLMALFNVRLGWWLQNPYKNTYWTDVKRFFGLPYLFKELLAISRLDDKYINLSDGGHFENLGVYELLRRECRLIIVSDAGCDPDHVFDDLGRLFHLARIDLGINITEMDLSCFDKSSVSGVAPVWDQRLCQRAHAIARINYKDNKSGVLIYLKASLPGPLKEKFSGDVMNYVMQNVDYPHQSTADQFFDAQQFEAYRQLGKLIADDALEFYF